MVDGGHVLSRKSVSLKHAQQAKSVGYRSGRVSSLECFVLLRESIESDKREYRRQ